MIGLLVDLGAIEFHFLVEQVVLIGLEVAVVDFLIDKLFFLFLIMALGALMNHIGNRHVTELSPLSLFNPLNESLDNVVPLDYEQYSHSDPQHNQNGSEHIDEASTDQ